MSAIVGILQFGNEPIKDEYKISLMKSLEKFPADDIQTWQKENFFVGCLSQWITPESIGEQLPYFDPNTRCVITADAIIDNRLELFEKLQIKHYDRKTTTDSQLILLAYYKWGKDSPKYLVGDFCFVIWDEKEKKLFGARDFSGSRTLYFFKNEKYFVFCTIIQPLFTLPFIEKKLNEQWLAQYLAITGMIDVIEPESTVYKKVFQIPPSHCISIEDNNVSLRQYCKLIPSKKLKLKSGDEYVEAFKEVYTEAIQSRLRTYRNVGAQLSGGLDSGSIVSIAAPSLKEEKKLLHTFSFIPPNDFTDFTPSHLTANEKPFIQETVKYVGNIKSEYCSFEGRDPFSEIDSFLDTMEMPYKFFENSFWIKGMFENANRESVGILLNGGRGNLSISWGSAIDFYTTLLKKLKWLSLYKELVQYSKNIGAAPSRIMKILITEAVPTIKSESSYEFPMIINQGFARRTNVFEQLKEHGMDETGWFSGTNIYEHRKRHFEDVFHWNASNTVSSKLSLEFSLWKRDPTNDIRVVRFCQSLPEGQYVQGGLDRALIRRATKGLLPDSIRLNQRIQGVQGADWIYRMAPKWNEFREEILNLSKDKMMKEFLNLDLIAEAISRIPNVPEPKHALSPYLKILMRSLIIYKFLRKIN